MPIMLSYGLTMGQVFSVTKIIGALRKTRHTADQSSEETVRSNTIAEQLAILTRQLEEEKRRNNQLILLSELSRQLETLLDPPVAAQLVVNTLERGIACSYVCLYTVDEERNEFVVMASAGQMTHLIPPGYRQNIRRGIAGRAARLRKTQVSNDTRLDFDFFPFEHETSLSALVVPLIHNGYLHGILNIHAEQADAFHSADVSLAEAAANELTRAWERSRYHQNLTELIQAGISLSTMVEPQSVVREVASITRQTLSARFVYVVLLDQTGNFSQHAYSGHAPKLLKYFEDTPLNKSITQATLNASQPFRIRDIRKYPLTENIQIDNSSLRSALVLPIRLHRLSVGAILAFGKENEIFFTEDDESLGTLLASQAAAALESTWLYQELRNTLTTTTQLYQVSFQILQIEDLREAVKLILETACKVANAGAAGVVNV
ncbi:MAG: GAF domain-containing protein, partial [Chloroflexi bacterium]|nr:GAF domain-containing protein [Chloroflexota bacterium]